MNTDLSIFGTARKPCGARRWSAATVFVGALVYVGAAGSVAVAQGIPTVSPGGELANPAAPPSKPALSGRRAPIVLQGKPDGSGGTTFSYGDPEAGPQRYFQGQGDYSDDAVAQWDVKQHGPVPEHHVVRKGDTLWDLSWLYFNNPWEWPKVWSYNPTITNPHWIYPGDLVRLYPKGRAPVIIAAAAPDEPADVASTRPPPTTYSFDLRQIAYVDREKLEYAGTITGAVDSKVMLSTNDQVYVEYPEGKPPKVGTHYAIYTETKAVRHPDGKKGKVGSYVRIIGELRILSAKEKKRARAVIEQSSDVIERGARVGPIQRKYRGLALKPRANKRNLRGTILAMLHNDQLIGQGEIVFIDIGKKDGLERGNILHVVRRGDAMEKQVENTIGQDDKAYPSRSLGRVIVVDLGKHASACVVLHAAREIGVGDRVLMRKSR